jgi:hypothetical protein
MEEVSAAAAAAAAAVTARQRARQAFINQTCFEARSFEDWRNAAFIGTEWGANLAAKATQPSTRC